MMLTTEQLDQWYRDQEEINQLMNDALKSVTKLAKALNVDKKDDR